MPFFVESNFFCIFKTGDNIVYNLKTLTYFYELYEQGDNDRKKMLIKPVVICIASIVEAILHDFHLRIRANRHEGVINLPNTIIAYISGKQIDEFEKYIASAKKHNLFDGYGEGFYEGLDLLRKIRNRIHIQNKTLEEPRDEALIFRPKAKELAEKCAEIVIKTMNREYGRPMKPYVEDLQLPWDEHFPELDEMDEYELLGL